MESNDCPEIPDRGETSDNCGQPFHVGRGCLTCKYLVIVDWLDWIMFVIGCILRHKVLCVLNCCKTFACNFRTRTSPSWFKVYKSLVTSMFLLYGCETWTLLADSEKEINQAFQTKCLRELLRVL